MRKYKLSIIKLGINGDKEVEFMSRVISQEGMQKALSWAWDKSLNGVPGIGTAEELAESYLTENSSVENAIDELITCQCRKCGASGFMTGLGGLVTLPVAIPANISSVLYMQLRMIAAIAYMCHEDIHSDRVQTLAYSCLCGKEMGDVLKDAGIECGEKILAAQINRIPGTVIKAINRAVGLRLITKFGSKGFINLGKLVPVIGGAIGGGFDFYTTKAIGKNAKEVFYSRVA